MSVMPIEPNRLPAGSPGLLSEAAAGNDALMTSLPALTAPLSQRMLVDWEAKAAERRRAEEARRQAEKQAQERRVREQYHALPAAQRAVVDKAVSDAADLLQGWHTGALQAVGTFKSKLLPAEPDKTAALAVNLLWVVAGLKWKLLPLAVVSEFTNHDVTKVVKAAFPLLDNRSRWYADLTKQTAEDLTTRVNNLKDALLTNLDIVLLPLLESHGLDRYGAMDRPAQLAHLWRGLFSAPSQGDWTEAARRWCRTTLEDADAAAVKRQATLEGAWKASLRAYKPNVVSDVTWAFDGREWKRFTPDPVELYAMDPIQPFARYSPFLDPCPPHLRVARARLLFRLALEGAFPALE